MIDILYRCSDKVLPSAAGMYLSQKNELQSTDCYNTDSSNFLSLQPYLYMLRSQFYKNALNGYYVGRVNNKRVYNKFMQLKQKSNLLLLKTTTDISPMNTVLFQHSQHSEKQHFRHPTYATRKAANETLYITVIQF